MDGKFEDSSFVLITGPPQQGKRKRISHVRSQIRKARLRQESRQKSTPMQRTVALGDNVPLLGPPPRQFTHMIDLSWLPVSAAVSERLKLFLYRYIEASVNIHPFFRSVVPGTVAHIPLMSAKLVNASSWDDLNGPTGEISELTLFQRGIAERILLDSTTDLEAASCESNIIAILTLLAFEFINGSQEAYVQLKSKACELIASRRGLDNLGFDGHLKSSLLMMDKLERAVKDFALSAPRLESSDISRIKIQISFPQPLDLRLFTFERGQSDLWGRKINLSTIRLLADFYQAVTLSISYQQSSNHQAEQQRILTQWNFLRESIFALKSTPFHHESNLDLALVCAISMFLSFGDENGGNDDTQTSEQELRSLLLDSEAEAQRSHLQGAFIWCLAVTVRRSQPGPIRKWFLMQLTRMACPAALDDPVNVSKNVDMIFCGLDGVEALKIACLRIDEEESAATTLNKRQSLWWMEKRSEIA